MSILATALAIPFPPQLAFPVEGVQNFTENIDQKTLQIWKKFAWTSAPPAEMSAGPNRDLSSLLPQAPDCIQFLRESGLLYLIRGYQHSLDQAQGPIDISMTNIQEGIKLDADSHPLFLVEGDWMRWDALNELVRYDAEKKEIVSVLDPEQEWNYFSPSGLCPVSRYNKIYPIYQLTPEEMQTLQNHGEKYFTNNVPQELDENKENWRYLQVFTSDNAFCSKLSHAGIRLIDEAGKVYSLGYETTRCKVPFPEQQLSGTYDASITSLDYDEFKPYKTRRVTTIPLTQAQYDAAKGKIKDYTERPLRFNRIHQNCATYVTDIMKVAGHQIDITCTLIDWIPSLAPRIKDIPYIGPVIHKIGKCVMAALAWIASNIIPSFLKRVIDTVAAAISALVNKIFAIITNVLSLLFGATKCSEPLDNVEDKTIDNRDGLQYFDRLIEEPADILKNEPSTIHSPTKLVEWQLDQKSTFIHKYDGSPRFTIIPREEN